MLRRPLSTDVYAVESAECAAVRSGGLGCQCDTKEQGWAGAPMGNGCWIAEIICNARTQAAMSGYVRLPKTDGGTRPLYDMLRGFSGGSAPACARRLCCGPGRLKMAGS